MKLDDLFEDMRPAATVWKKRGNKIERGKISRYVVNLNPLTQIGHDCEKAEDQESEGKESARSSAAD